MRKSKRKETLVEYTGRLFQFYHLSHWASPKWTMDSNYNNCLLTTAPIVWRYFFYLICCFFVFIYFCLIIEISTDFDMEFKRELGRGTSTVEMRQELRAATVAFWMKVAEDQLDPGTPISYAVQVGGTSLKYVFRLKIFLKWRLLQVRWHEKKSVSQMVILINYPKSPKLKCVEVN